MTGIQHVPAQEGHFDEWDDEELARGMRRNRNGMFRGRPPKSIPFELHRELTRRRFSRANDLLAESLADAAEMLRSIVNDEDADPYARMRAADMIFDRVIGKPRESVEVAFGAGVGGEIPKWQQVVASSVVATADQAMDLLERRREKELERAVHEDDEVEVVEGEVVDDDEEEEE